MSLNPKKIKRKRLFLILFMVAPFVLPVCAFAQVTSEREVVVLAVNDVYRIEGAEGGQRGGLARVRTLRRQLSQHNPDLLFLHAGDFLFPSLLSEWTHGAHMVEMMNVLDGAPGVHDPHMFVVFGNHEFDKSQRKDATLLQERIDQSEFHWLGSNIRFARENGEPLVASGNLMSSRIVVSGGIRVGIFGLTTDTKSAKEIAYVDEFMDPIRLAREQTKVLREQGAELVIALTHLSINTDREILKTLGSMGPDLIIGGHEHQRHHVEIGGRWILKADADARTATVVRIRMIRQRPFISFGYRFLNREHLTPDPEMQRWVDEMLSEHEEWFCSNQNEDASCLSRPLGKTGVPLIGEELEIRRYETNLGNWVAGQMRSAFEDADLAFINAGSLRLNRNIPFGPITRRHVEELLPYDGELVRTELDREQLDQVLERATEDWVGEGHWLQISGIAFTHDPRKRIGERVDTIALWRDGNMVELPDRPLRIVTTKFLIEGGDGYDMLKPVKWVPVAESLKQRIRETFRASARPIQPRVDGRICNLAEIDKRPCAFKDILHK